MSKLSHESNKVQKTFLLQELNDLLSQTVLNEFCSKSKELCWKTSGSPDKGEAYNEWFETMLGKDRFVFKAIMYVVVALDFIVLQNAEGFFVDPQ